ncbi:MAG: thiamine phosphate synthase [Puniceicoccaceae bacterium]
MSVPEIPSCGFYAILDTGYINDSEWEYQADAILSGGACILQIRAMGDPLERVRELVERVQPVARSHKVPLVINDHLELAATTPGLGLHMGQGDGPIDEARKRLGPDRILGLSTHSLDEAKKAMEASDILSYFTIGPIFPSQTHAEYKPVGIDLIRAVASLEPALPFFCIGGITPDNTEKVVAAGARGIIAASFSLRHADLESTARFYTQQLTGERDA